MLKLIALIVLLQGQIIAYAQDPQNVPVNVETVSGTYHYKSASFKLNKNQTCKIIFTAPQKLTYEGVWRLQNDTLVCTYNHISLSMNGINEELKEDPFSQKYLCSGNSLSLVDGQNYRTIVYLKEEE